MEVIAACLAADLQLPISKPFILDVIPGFAEAIPDAEISRLVRESSTVAFGSQKLPTQFGAWNAGNRITKALLPDALAVFVFDAIIQNPDRRSENPNCLIMGDNIRIFDHEVAFRHKLMWFPPWKAPWLIGGLESLRSPGSHIFRAGLMKHSLNFAPVRDAWAEVTDARLAMYSASVQQFSFLTFWGWYWCE